MTLVEALRVLVAQDSKQHELREARQTVEQTLETELEQLQQVDRGRQDSPSSIRG